MAAPLNSAKQTVDMAAPSVRGSRIRRDPPAKPKKELSLKEREHRDIWIAVIGMSVFTLALVVAAIGSGNYFF